VDESTGARVAGEAARDQSSAFSLNLPGRRVDPQGPPGTNGARFAARSAEPEWSAARRAARPSTGSRGGTSRDRSHRAVTPYYDRCHGAKSSGVTREMIRESDQQTQRRLSQRLQFGVVTPTFLARTWRTSETDYLHATALTSLLRTPRRGRERTTDFRPGGGAWSRLVTDFLSCEEPSLPERRHQSDRTPLAWPRAE